MCNENSQNVTTKPFIRAPEDYFFKKDRNRNFRKVIHKPEAIDREKMKYWGTDESQANLGGVHQRMF